MTDFLYKKSINTSNECLNFECSNGSMVMVFLKLSVKQQTDPWFKLHRIVCSAAFKYLLQHLNICCVSGISEVQESLLPWLVYGMNWMELNESSATHSRKESSHLNVCLSVEWIEILRDIAAVLLSLHVKWLAIYVSALPDVCVSLVCHVILFFFHLCLFEDYQCVALSDLSCAVTITVTVTNHHQPLQDVFLFPPWREMKMGTRYCSTVTLPMSNVCAQRWGELLRTTYYRICTTSKALYGEGSSSQSEDIEILVFFTIDVEVN